MTASARTRNRHRHTTTTVVVLALVLLAALACSNGSAASASATVLESNTSVGDDPFTDSVTVTQVGNFPSSVQAVTVSFQQSLPADPATGTKTTTGTAPGLYGGTQDSTACDAAKMITYLGANPDKANAWASVQGIDPSTVGDYIGKLTPVILTTDTWVTNHGYRDGAATARPAVLQAGTAVLVDTYGTPRAKCSCGNPLTPPPDNTNLDHTKTQGTPWPDYQPANVTTITPAPDPTTNLTLTNIQTGTTFQQPVGSGGATGTFVATATDSGGGGSIYTSTDGQTWKQVYTAQNPVTAVVHGPDGWVALTTPQYSGPGSSHLLKSQDGQSWSDAGEVGSPQVNTLAYGDGTWLAAGSASGEAGAAHQVYVYRSTDLTSWTKAGDVALPDYDEPHDQSLAYGNGQWALLDLAAAGPHGFDFTIASSRDGSSWQPVTAGNQDLFPAGPLMGGDIAFGGGSWVVAGTAGFLADINGSGGSSVGVAAKSTDLSSWQTATVGDGLDILAISYGSDDKWYATTGNSQSPSVLYVSSDGLTYQQAGDLPPKSTFVIRG